MSTDTQTVKAVWKKPDDMCGCMKQMDEWGLFRWGQVSFTDNTVAPVLEKGRNSKAPFAFLKFCPNCGAENFIRIEASE